MMYLVDQAEAAIVLSAIPGSLGNGNVDVSATDDENDSGSAAEGDSGFEAGGNDSARRLMRAAVRSLTTNQEFVFAFVFVAVGLAAPLLLLHYLDFKKNYWQLGGTVRKLLQENLMQRFLYCEEANRARLSSSDLVMCMTHDVLELTQCGFMQIFRFVACTSKLTLIFVFQILTAVYN